MEKLMKGDLLNRVNRAEQKIILHPSAEIRIKAIMKSISGEEDGEALEVLLSHESFVTDVNRHELRMVAMARLETREVQKMPI